MALAPEIMSQAHNELVRASPAPINMATRKAVTNDWAIAELKAACVAGSTPGGTSVPANFVL